MCMPRRPFRPAFTLLELLVTVALVMVIAGIIIVSLFGAIGTAEDVKSAATLRQMSLGYTGYATDHDDALMPGYVRGASVDSLGLQARLDNGNRLPNFDDSSSYLWRLAPYLADDWRAAFDDYQSPSVIARLADEIADGTYGPGSAGGDQFGAASVTSYGLNTVFLGGDDVHSNLSGSAPWSDPYGTPAATSQSQVITPSRIVVFAPSKRFAQPGITISSDIEWGGPALIAPFLTRDNNGTWINQQWTVDTDDSGDLQRQRKPVFVSDSLGGVASAPFARRETTLPTVHLDGSVSQIEMIDLANDMRNWWWKAQAIDR